MDENEPLVAAQSSAEASSSLRPSRGVSFKLPSNDDFGQDVESSGEESDDEPQKPSHAAPKKQEKGPGRPAVAYDDVLGDVPRVESIMIRNPAAGGQKKPKKSVKLSEDSMPLSSPSYNNPSAASSSSNQPISYQSPQKPMHDAPGLEKPAMDDVYRSPQPQPQFTPSRLLQKRVSLQSSDSATPLLLSTGSGDDIDDSPSFKTRPEGISSPSDIILSPASSSAISSLVSPQSPLLTLSPSSPNQISSGHKTPTKAPSSLKYKSSPARSVQAVISFQNRAKTAEFVKEMRGYEASGLNPMENPDDALAIAIPSSASVSPVSSPSNANDKQKKSKSDDTPSFSAADDEEKEEEMKRGGDTDLDNPLKGHALLEKFRSNKAQVEPAIPQFWRECMMGIRILMIIILSLILAGVFFSGSALFLGKIHWSTDSLLMYPITEETANRTVNPITPYGMHIQTKGNALVGHTIPQSGRTFEVADRILNVSAVYNQTGTAADPTAVMPILRLACKLNTGETIQPVTHKTGIVLGKYSSRGEDAYGVGAAGSGDFTVTGGFYQQRSPNGSSSSFTVAGGDPYITIEGQMVTFPWSPYIGKSFRSRGCVEFPGPTEEKMVNLCYTYDGYFYIRQGGVIYVSISDIDQLFLRGKMIYNTNASFVGQIAGSALKSKYLFIESVFQIPVLKVLAETTRDYYNFTRQIGPPAYAGVVFTSNGITHNRSLLFDGTKFLFTDNDMVDSSGGVIRAGKTTAAILPGNWTQFDAPELKFDWTQGAAGDPILVQLQSSIQSIISVKCLSDLTCTSRFTSEPDSAFTVTHALLDNPSIPRGLTDDVSTMSYYLKNKERLRFTLKQTYNNTLIGRRRFSVLDFTQPGNIREVTTLSSNHGGYLVSGIKEDPYEYRTYDPITGLLSNSTIIANNLVSDLQIFTQQMTIRNPNGSALLTFEPPKNRTHLRTSILFESMGTTTLSSLSLERDSTAHSIASRGPMLEFSQQPLRPLSSSSYTSMGQSLTTPTFLTAGSVSMLRFYTTPAPQSTTLSNIFRIADWNFSSIVLGGPSVHSFSMKMRAVYNSYHGTTSTLFIKSNDSNAATVSFTTQSSSSFTWAIPPSSNNVELQLSHITPVFSAPGVLDTTLSNTPLKLYSNVSLVSNVAKTYCTQEFVSLGEFAGFQSGISLIPRNRLIIVDDASCIYQRFDRYESTLQLHQSSPRVTFSSYMELASDFKIHQYLQLGTYLFVTQNKPVTILQEMRMAALPSYLVIHTPSANRSRSVIYLDDSPLHPSTMKLLNPMIVSKSMYIEQLLQVGGNTTTRGNTGLILLKPSGTAPTLNSLPIKFVNSSTGHTMTLYRNLSAVDTYTNPTLSLTGDFKADKTSLVNADLIVTGILSGSFSVNPGTSTIDVMSLQTSGRPLDTIKLPTGRTVITLVDTAVPQQIKVIYCKVVNCTDNYMSIVDAVPDTTGFIGFGAFIASFITADNKLAFVYPVSIGNTQTLRIGICANVFCTSLYATYTVVTGILVSFPSVALGTDGNPFVAFNSGNNLYFAKCVDIYCATTVTPVLAGSGLDSYGIYTSVVMGSDGNPFIAFHDKTSGNLNSLHCLDPTCASRDPIDRLDGFNGYSAGAYISTTVGIDGFVLIAHQEFSGTPGNEYLRVLHCGDLRCSPGRSSTSRVDSDAGSGQFTSVAIGDDGLPVMSAFTVHIKQADGGRMMKISHCNDPECLTSVTNIIDGGAGKDVGSFTSIALGTDFLPVVSYFDTKNRRLKFHHCSNRLCVPSTRFTRYT